MSCSRGEIKIKEILEMNGLNFQQEYSFPDLPRRLADGCRAARGHRFGTGFRLL